MTRQTEELLEAFDRLPEEERRIFTQEVFRRVLPFELGPLTEEEIGAASDARFKALDAVTLSPEQEQLLDQRWNEYLQDPSQGVPWETVQSRRRREAP
jgi:putative addiction module component (TIGR02574 family)